MASSLSERDNASIQIHEDYRRRLDAFEGFTPAPHSNARKREDHRRRPCAPERPERSRNLEPQGHQGHRRDLSALETLNLKGTKVTDAGVQQLLKALPRAKIKR